MFLESACSFRAVVVVVFNAVVAVFGAKSQEDRRGSQVKHDDDGREEKKRDTHSFTVQWMCVVPTCVQSERRDRFVSFLIEREKSGLQTILKLK